MPSYIDFNERPFIVIWETTQACDLACMHCRASAQPLRHPLELTTSEAKRLIDEVAELKAPVFVLTGGDPLKRPDTYDLVEYATTHGVRTSLTPSATPLLTPDAIAELKRRGLARLAVSLDASSAQLHDAFRRVPGSYDWTLRAVRSARAIGLPVQINTTITRHNLDDLDRMIALLETLDIVLWSVFFLVPTGRGKAVDLITAEEFEQVFEKLYQTAQRVRFDIRSTEAQHYRRFLLQRRVEERKSPPFAKTGRKGGPPIDIGSDKGGPPLSGAPLERKEGKAVFFPVGMTADGIGRAPKGINDGKGFVFVSHLGEVFPSGFLPISAGNVRKHSLGDLYRNSPLFVALRDTSKLEGKCGVCEFREVCGGSRARAYALTGNPFAEEPCCVYVPKTVVRSQRSGVSETLPEAS